MLTPGYGITQTCPLRSIDRPTGGFYSCAMTDSTPKHEFEVELKRLENRLDDLVEICSQLKEENRSLKQRQDALTADRASLLQKNEQVRARVEAMISRLKAMENG